MKVAFAGLPGAFAHEACRTFLPEHEPVAHHSFADVAAAVTEGRVDCGMLPLENNEAGLVEEAQVLLPSLNLVAEHWLPVRMHLLALPGVDLAEVQTVVSHPVALKQCARTLSGLGLRTEAAVNTAVAAQSLVERSKAALASAAAAEAYGLNILIRDVHDRADNATRFGIVERAAK